MEEPGIPNQQTKLTYAEKLLNTTLQHSSNSGIHYQLKINLYYLCRQLSLPTKHITLVPTF